MPKQEDKKTKKAIAPPKKVENSSSEETTSSESSDEVISRDWLHVVFREFLPLRACDDTCYLLIHCLMFQEPVSRVVSKLPAPASKNGSVKRKKESSSSESESDSDSEEDNVSSVNLAAFFHQNSRFCSVGLVPYVFMRFKIF